MATQCHCVNVTDLERPDRDRMYALFTRHFDRTDRDRFETDLTKKRWVLQLIDDITGELRGFSTQTLLEFHCRGVRGQAIFSGDTIVDPQYWWETVLIRQWGRLVSGLLKSQKNVPLYWFLISKGYKTYRFLPVFFREFYPRFDQDTPAWAKDARDVLGRILFHDDYDPQRGLVVASTNKDRLRAELAHVESSRLADPHVRFFLESNPHYARGDELCCLAPLEFNNFTRAGVRLLDPENRIKVAGVHCE